MLRPLNFYSLAKARLREHKGVNSLLEFQEISEANVNPFRDPASDSCSYRGTISIR